jgi:hypothetical protein
MALTANRQIDHLPDQQLRQFPIAAGKHIYAGAFVGLDPAGYAKPFEVCDVVAGVAYDEQNNTDGDAGALYVRLYVQGDFVHSLSGAGHSDTGKALYATADNAVALKGHPDAFVGRVVHKDADAGNSVVFRLKDTPGVLSLNPLDEGHIECVDDFTHSGPTGAASATVYTRGGFHIKSILGLGNVALTTVNGGTDLQLDNATEVALASIRTLGLFKASAGVTLDARLHVKDKGDDASLDIDVGLGTPLTANSEADLSHANLTDKACFHMNGNSNNIYAWSEATDVETAETDTTVDNVEAVAETSYKDLHIKVRPTGAVEFWIDRVRVLAASTFAVAAAAQLAGFVNVEKTSNDTLCEVYVRKVRVAGGRT